MVTTEELYEQHVKNVEFGWDVCLFHFFNKLKMVKHISTHVFLLVTDARLRKLYMQSDHKHKCSTSYSLYMPSPCFMLVCFSPFCFKVPCQFRPFLNLRSLLFGLTPIGWELSITLIPHFWIEFLFTIFCLIPLFQESNYGIKKGWVYWTLYVWHTC
jgi:hypothetical protein